MTLVKFKNRPVEQNFNNAMDDFFAHFPSLLKEDFVSSNRQNAPVNILETENGYQLQLIAPGFNKDAFKLSLENNLLTIAADQKSENDAKVEKHIRQEYKFQSFKRSFTVDEKIDTENIEAKYENGVLIVNLPKKAEVKASPKNINVLLKKDY